MCHALQYAGVQETPFLCVNRMTWTTHSLNYSPSAQLFLTVSLPHSAQWGLKSAPVKQRQVCSLKHEALTCWLMLMKRKPWSRCRTQCCSGGRVHDCKHSSGGLFWMLNDNGEVGSDPAPGNMRTSSLSKPFTCCHCHHNYTWYRWPMPPATHPDPGRYGNIKYVCFIVK